MLGRTSVTHRRSPYQVLDVLCHWPVPGAQLATQLMAACVLCDVRGTPKHNPHRPQIWQRRPHFFRRAGILK